MGARPLLPSAVGLQITREASKQTWPVLVAVLHILFTTYEMKPAAVCPKKMQFQPDAVAHTGLHVLGVLVLLILIRPSNAVNAYCQLSSPVPGGYAAAFTNPITIKVFTRTSPAAQCETSALMSSSLSISRFLSSAYEPAHRRRLGCRWCLAWDHTPQPSPKPLQRKWLQAVSGIISCRQSRLDLESCKARRSVSSPARVYTIYMYINKYVYLYFMRWRSTVINCMEVMSSA